MLGGTISECNIYTILSEHIYVLVSQSSSLRARGGHVNLGCALQVAFHAEHYRQVCLRE